MEQSIVTPIIHPNGDRKKILVIRLKHAYHYLREAEQAVLDCAPNGRNFYPEPGRLERYQVQHRERLKHIDAVMQSLLAEVQHIEAEYPGQP